ncbi:hypothetical protein Tco_1219696 [Tanacetum coccineum]
MYHRTGGFTGHEREVYKSLVSRLIHERRVIESTFLDDQPNLRSTFAAIGFDCLLNIDEKICPVFVLQFYKSVRIIRVCVYTPEWPISSLQNGVDFHLDIYPPPHEDSSLICHALFYERTQPKTRKMKGVDTTLDPFQMIVSELKTHLKKWKIILNENAVSLTKNKDHPNACLCYMFYCLTIGKYFNLAYYIANRMVSVTKSADMTLTYRMLLTLLFELVPINHPYSFSNELYLVDHVMIPLSEKRVFRFKDKGKRPRLSTSTPLDTESFNSPFLTPHQRVENDPVNNYTLDPIPYMNQLPPIEGGDSRNSSKPRGCAYSIFSPKRSRSAGSVQLQSPFCFITEWLEPATQN